MVVSDWLDEERRIGTNMFGVVPKMVCEFGLPEWKCYSILLGWMDSVKGKPMGLRTNQLRVPVRTESV